MIALFLFTVLGFIPEPGMAAGLGEPLSGAVATTMVGTIGHAPAAFLAAVSLSEAQIGMAVLAFITALIGYHFIAQKYIRDAAGTKADPHSVSIADQPVQMQAVVRFVAHDELDTRLANYVTSEDLHATEQRLDGKMEENFRALDDKRSRSIGNLHEHLTGTTEKLGNKIEESARLAHSRTDALAQQVGILIGEVKHVAQQAAEATRAAQAAAVAAASATNKGGRA